MRRSVEDARIVPENILRAVAVMDVEIDDGDALRAVRGSARDGRRSAALLKKQKPIGVARLGVMAGRARRDEGVGDAPAHHLVDRA